MQPRWSYFRTENQIAQKLFILNIFEFPNTPWQYFSYIRSSFQASYLKFLTPQESTPKKGTPAKQPVIGDILQSPSVTIFRFEQKIICLDMFLECMTLIDA